MLRNLIGLTGRLHWKKLTVRERAAFPRCAKIFLTLKLSCQKLILACEERRTIVTPPNSIESKCVTCRGSKLANSPRWTKLTNSLARETATWTFDLHVIRSCSLKPRQICEPAGVKLTISSQSFFYFWGSQGNKTHCFSWGQSLSA